MSGLAGLKGKAFFGTTEKVEKPVPLGKYTKNQVVLVQGLKNKAELNGRDGKIVRFDEAADRYGIQICKAPWPGMDKDADALTDQVFALKEANFEVQGGGCDDAGESSADEEYETKARGRKALFKARMEQVFPGGWPPKNMSFQTRADRVGLPTQLRQYPRRGESPVLIISGQPIEEEEECSLFAALGIMNERPELWRQWGCKFTSFKNGESSKANDRCRRLIDSGEFKRIVVTDMREPDMADMMTDEGDKPRNGLEAFVQELGPNVIRFVEEYGGQLAFSGAQGHQTLEKVLSPLFGSRGLSWKVGKDERAPCAAFPGNLAKVAEILGEKATKLQFPATGCCLTDVPEDERFVVAGPDEKDVSFEGRTETLVAIRNQGEAGGRIGYFGDVNSEYACSMMLVKFLEHGLR